MKRIGLFGGSFDPPHNAHLALAHVALDHLALDELRWVPVGQQWQKTRELAPAADREAMVLLAIAGAPRFVLERCELQRSGPSYTIDTVVELQAATPGAQWFLVIGEDQYRGFHTWRGFAELLQKVTLAVACRDSDSLRPSAELAAHPHTLTTLPLPRIALSSTRIRDAVTHSWDVTRMVPAAVARYIDRHHLYRGNPRS